MTQKNNYSYYSPNNIFGLNELLTIGDLREHINKPLLFVVNYRTSTDDYDYAWFGKLDETTFDYLAYKNNKQCTRLRYWPINTTDFILVQDFSPKKKIDMKSMKYSSFRHGSTAYTHVFALNHYYELMYNFLIQISSPFLGNKILVEMLS